MRMNNFKLTLTSVLLLGVSCYGTAFAQDNSDGSVDSPASIRSVMDIYLEDYPNATREEATEILSQEMNEEITSVLNCVKNDLYFAGMYQSHVPSFRIDVKFTENPEINLNKCSQNPIFTPTIAVNTITELEAAKEAVMNRLNFYKMEYRMGVSHQTNKLEIDVPKGSLLTIMNLINSFDIKGTIFKFNEVDKIGIEFTAGGGSSGPLQVRGNMKVSHTYGQDCTTGYVVESTDSVPTVGVTTAGHCPDAKVFLGSNPVNVEPGQSDPGMPGHDPNVDLQFMTVGVGDPNLVEYLPEINYHQVQAGLTMDVLGSQNSGTIGQGAYICSIGHAGAPARQCGNYSGFQSFNGYGTFPTATQPNSTSLTSFAQPGDSGGPVFFEYINGIPQWGVDPFVVALGTMVGHDLSENGVLYFTPMERFVDIGVVLKLD